MGAGSAHMRLRRTVLASLRKRLPLLWRSPYPHQIRFANLTPPGRGSKVWGFALDCSLPFTPLHSPSLPFTPPLGESKLRSSFGGGKLPRLAQTLLLQARADHTPHYDSRQVSSEQDFTRRVLICMVRAHYCVRNNKVTPNRRSATRECAGTPWKACTALKNSVTDRKRPGPRTCHHFGQNENYRQLTSWTAGSFRCRLGR